MKKLAIVIYLIYSVAFTPIAAKLVVHEISPLSFAFIRFGTATLLFVFVFFFRKEKFAIEKSDRVRFLILGALVIPINQFCFLQGISLSFASHSGIIYSCTPLFTYFVSIIIKTDTFNYKKLFTIILTIIGIFLIFYENIIKINTGNPNIFIGDILLIFAVASWASYLSLSEPMVRKYGAIKSSTVSFIIGMIMYIPIFIFDSKNFNLDKLTIAGVFGYIHLAILVAFGAYFVFTYSLKIMNISSLTTFLNSTPIVTIIFSWILLKEEISYFFIIGSLITLSGVFLSQYLKYGNILDSKYEYILQNNSGKETE